MNDTLSKKWRINLLKYYFVEDNRVFRINEDVKSVNYQIVNSVLIRYSYNMTENKR